MTLKRTAEPELLPVSLDEARRHCIVSHDSENAILFELLQAATRLVEDHTERQFMAAPWILRADCFSRLVEIRVCPVQSIESVKYYDLDGEQQTLDEEAYLVDTDSEPARLTPAPDTTWPTTQRRINAVEIEFTAGYGDRDSVPPNAKRAILLLTGHWFANREAVGQVGNEIALAYSTLIWSLKWSL